MATKRPQRLPLPSLPRQRTKKKGQRLGSLGSRGAGLSIGVMIGLLDLDLQASGGEALSADLERRAATLRTALYQHDELTTEGVVLR